MPDIRLYTPCHATDERYNNHVQGNKHISLGTWRFDCSHVEPVSSPTPGGRMEVVGYNETYSNPFISQEERDQLWMQFLQETGQRE